MHQNSQYAMDQRKKIVAAARAMLAGTISFIEGARAICAISTSAGLPHDDEDLVPFALIESETDALPAGDVRQLWNQQALEKLQPEIDSAELWARDVAVEHCQKLIERFG
jgi:hypothetical protein